jgi:multidrug efflux pump subunit AcrA (membrane-fusion protein)
MTSPDPVGPSEQAEARPPETPFRERALGGTPNPLEHIDHLFHHTSRRIWLGILGVAILLGAGVVWSAVAKEVTTVQAPGVVVPREGLYRAGDFQAGVVVSVRVSEDDVVREGQELAVVEEPGSGREVSVPSPIPGRIVSVEVRAGDASQPGSPMFLIAPLQSELIAVGLFPAAGISQLSVGQEAAVAVNGVPPSLYGTAVGRVVSIGEIPVSDLRLVQLTGDTSLSALVAQLGPLREVGIELTPADTPSGIAWTRGKGPPAPLPVGVRAVSSVTIGRETLLSKAFG